MKTEEKKYLVTNLQCKSNTIQFLFQMEFQTIIG